MGATAWTTYWQWAAWSGWKQVTTLPDPIFVHVQTNESGQPVRSHRAPANWMAKFLIRKFQWRRCDIVPRSAEPADLTALCIGTWKFGSSRVLLHWAKNNRHKRVRCLRVSTKRVSNVSHLKKQLKGINIGLPANASNAVFVFFWMSKTPTRFTSYAAMQLSYTNWATAARPPFVTITWRSLVDGQAQLSGLFSQGATCFDVPIGSTKIQKACAKGSKWLKICLLATDALTLHKSFLF